VTWATFYLVCFVVGFALSVFSLLGGGGRSHSLSRFHWAHGGLHHGPVLHGGVGHGAAGHAGGLHAHAAGKSIASQGQRASFFDFTTLMAFLCWFGGTGYLLTRYTSIWAVVALGFASMSGLAGAGLVFLFLAKVLLAREAILDPSDYYLVGALAKVTSGIHAGGTGEIVYSQGGTRHTCGARSEDGVSVPHGEEVVVTRYEGGIAYVRRFDELADKTNS
jgi:membrane protein implicated in regulation of membrane protease activity